jgi:hypothetical protein
MARSDDAIQLLPDYCFAHDLVRLGLLVEEGHTSATLRTRPLWSILGASHVPVGVVGWPLTHPAPSVRGYVVGDTYLEEALTPSGLDRAASLYPPEIQLEALAALAEVAPEDADVVPAASVEGRFHTPGRTDRAFDRIARALAQSRPTQVTIVRYQSLDPIGHYFLRYAVPSEFGDVSDEERRRLGPVLERHYALIDEAVGRAIAGLGSDDLLLVVSGYGMQPVGLGRRVVEKLIGDAELSGTHDGAPEGFLMAYGGPVARGRPSPGWVVDVTPTVVYFLGLPVGRDMDGYARTDLFLRAFTEDRPITFIPTYDR